MSRYDDERINEREDRALRRAQLDSFETERLRSAVRHLVLVMVAVLAITVAAFIGWYLGGKSP